MELGLLCPEHMARPVPTLQQSQNLLVKLDFRRQLLKLSMQQQAQCLLVKLSASATAVVKSVGEARPPVF